ncbi:MAG: nitrite reductase [Deltaproteobacteria bacterium]|nr:nitrite reductase [Deltaproteobacteria bacterium]
MKGGSPRGSAPKAVPDVVPENIDQEIDYFEAMVKKFRAGEVSQDTFQKFRLQHGIYGQRQEGVQMVRIKIPGGLLNADQMECLADLAETIGHNNAHITTRQDIQIHYVKLENVPMLMRKLAAVGITTREACGNTVRNVTASPSAGVDPEEVFDVTPYMAAFAAHMIRNPICQNLGRKFKVAFDGGGVMTALPMLHEIGFIACVQKVGGREKRGFKVYTGGGLGSSPRVAKLFYDFLAEEEIIPFGESIIRVFDRYGERKVRMKARMKFLIEKFGFDQFKRLVEEERKSLEVPPEWNEYLKHLDDWVEEPPKIDEGSPPLSKGGGGDFLAWKKTNVWPQKQKGYSMVEIRLTTGDILPRQMRPLALLLRCYAGGKVRTMVHQNLLIRWVRDQDLPALYEGLEKIGLVKKDAQTVYDITACPGTDTCRLGISSSMGLARVLEERLYKEDGAINAAARSLRIKISGCPNSCGQHHLASLGFYGGGISVDGHVVPAFQLMLGGSFGREMVVATPICQIPSKNIPEAVVRLIQHFLKNKKPKESFSQYYDHLGKETIVTLLEDLTKIPPYEKRPDFYTDWEGKEEFALQKGVIGECAGQTVADVVPKVAGGETSLATAKALLGHGKFEEAADKAYEAIVKAADGLLYYRLVQTFNDVETTHEFENHFVRTGLLPQWKKFHQQLQHLRKEKPTEEIAEKLLEQAGRFVKECLEKEPEVAANSPRKGAVKPAVPDNLYV